MKVEQVTLRPGWLKRDIVRANKQWRLVGFIERATDAQLDMMLKLCEVSDEN